MGSVLKDEVEDRAFRLAGVDVVLGVERAHLVGGRKPLDLPVTSKLTRREHLQDVARTRYHVVADDGQLTLRRHKLLSETTGQEKGP